VVSYYGSPFKLKEEEGEPALEAKQEPESPVMEVKVEPVELHVPMEPMALALVKLQVDWNSPSEEEFPLPPSFIWLMSSEGEQLESPPPPPPALPKGN
jgi:hypothetical protein